MKKVFFRRAQKRATAARVFVVLAVIATSLSFSAPASAATLGSPTWTVMDPRTNISGNRYDYGFTATTAGVIDRVTASVPAGTTGANRYMATPGTSRNSASTPDSVANSPGTDLDLRLKVAPDVWALGGSNYPELISKVGNERSYQFFVGPTGGLAFQASSDGANWAMSSGPGSVPAFVDKQATWVRVTFQGNVGGNNVTKFWTSLDGTTWSQYGITSTYSGTVTIRDTTDRVNVASSFDGYGESMAGKFFYSDIRSSIGGTTTSPSTCSAAGVVNCFDPSNAAVGASTWTSQSTNAETWTLYRTGTDRPADIASDLSVMNRVGIGAGTAQLREIDGTASFKVTAPVNIPTSTPIKLGLAGMTNTYTAGSATSTVRTLSAGSTQIDAATTPAVNFTAPIVSAFSAPPVVLQAATPALNVDMMVTALSVNGNNVSYSDVYSKTVNNIDATAQTITRTAGTGIDNRSFNTPLTSAFGGVSGIVRDSAGNVFAADNGGSQIRKITATTTNSFAGGGADSSPTYSGVATGASISGVAGMVIDSADNIYFAERNRHIVRKLTPAGQLTTIAGDGTLGSSIGATALTTQLTRPNDVAINSAANVLYVADTGNSRVLRIDLVAGTASLFAGGGASYADGGSPTATNLADVRSVAVDPSGNVYIADAALDRVRVVSGSVISLFAGSGTRGFAGDGGAATSAQLNTPTIVRTDSAGALYIADYANSRLRKVSGGNITTFAGTGKSSWSGDGGPIGKANVFSPSQVRSDSFGNLFLAEVSNNVIRKIDKFGNVSTVAGLGPFLPGFSGDGGQASLARLNGPQDVMPDNAGNLWIADSNNARIRKIAPNGVINTVIATAGGPFQFAMSPDQTKLYATNNCQVLVIDTATGTNSATYGTTCGASAGDGGPATAAVFNIPRGVAADRAGNVYVSEYSGVRVRKITPDGMITTVAGLGTETADGGASRPRQLNVINRLAVDSEDSLYIQQYWGVVKVANSGTISRVAGTLNVSGNAGDGGAATSANFADIGGIGFNLGSMFISDTSSATLRKVDQQISMPVLVNNDIMSVALNTQRQWPILSNDWSRNNQMDPNSVVIKTQPANGTVTLVTSPTEAITFQAVFTPNNGFSGTNTFTYSACDTTMLQCGTATVTVNVSANNEVTTVAGGPTEGYGAEIGVSTAHLARFGRYLFYSDSLNQVIRRQDIFTGQSVVVAGSGTAGSGGDGGPATAASVKTTRRMAFTPDGSLYFADDGNNAIRYVTPSGTMTTLAALSNTFALAIKSDGTVLAQSGAAVKAWNGSAWVPFAGTGTVGSAGNGGPAVNATFNTPQSMFAAANGDVYIGDFDGCTVRVVSNGIINAFAGSGSCAVSGDNGPAVNAGIYRVESLTIMSNGTMIIGDNGGNRTRKVIGGILSTANTQGKALDLVPGPSGGAYGSLSTSVRIMNTSYAWSTTIVNANLDVSFAGDGRVGLQTQLGSTTASNGLVVGTDGVLYVQDDYRIRAFDTSANRVASTFAGNGLGYPTGMGGPTSQMILSPNGNPVFGINNCIIYERKPDTTLEVLAGTGTCGATGDGGLATAARINVAVGLAYASDGALIIADKLNNRIRRVDPTTKIITNMAGTGTLGSAGDGGLAINATFNNPQSLAMLPGGGMAIADVGNSRVRLIDAQGYVTTIVTGLSGARAIASDSIGNVFIAEQTGHRIRRYDANTGLTTIIAGSGTASYNENTTAVAAAISSPSGIAVSGTDVYFADAGNNRVRKITGAASAATNNLSSVTWSNVPTAVGHTDTLTRLSVTPAAAVTSSKLTFKMPTSFAAASAATVETFGLSGTVTPSVSGTTLTLAFPSQVLAAGVPIAVSVKNVTAIGAAGSYVITATAFDSAGTSAIGWSRSNVGNLQATGLPLATDPGFGSMWKRSMSTSSSALASVNVSPIAATDSTASFTISGAGSINARVAQLSSSAATTGTYNFSPITADSTTSVATGAFANNRWGLQVATSTGANTGATGPGLYSGVSPTPVTLATGTAANNVLTVTSRARIDFLQPAGTYRSTLTWRLTGGY